MSDARSNILARIRKAHGRAGGGPTEAEIREVREAMARHVIGPQPAFAHAGDAIAQFKRECDRLSTTYAEADRLEDVPREVGRYLEANDLEKRVVAWPELAGLPWTAAGVAIDDRPANGADRTGVTGCFCAIAETGTVLLLSGPRMPKVTALLPESHICVVSRSRMVEAIEDAFALLRREVGDLPRSAFFVSGPSRTADIEQTMVIGAHGPYREHVILVP